MRTKQTERKRKKDEVKTNDNARHGGLNVFRCSCKQGLTKIQVNMKKEKRGSDQRKRRIEEERRRKKEERRKKKGERRKKRKEQKKEEKKKRKNEEGT